MQMGVSRVMEGNRVLSLSSPPARAASWSQADRREASRGRGEQETPRRMQGTAGWGLPPSLSVQLIGFPLKMFVSFTVSLRDSAPFLVISSLFIEGNAKESKCGFCKQSVRRDRGVKLKEGMAFLGARPSNPTLWMVSQDVRSEGHRVVTLHCRRKESSYGQRSEEGVQRVLQVDLEVDSFLGPLGSRWITWQVEYPGSHATTQEAETEIRLAQKDLGGIVPLAMDTEILNTAVLTGKTVAVPVKVVTIGADGMVTDVSEAVDCHSTDEDVVKFAEVISP
ncbi:transmembrane protein 132C-like [Oncorhynchus nerka]|uniref:transmembrane protein 132C-like n=1 Tax=Oncorhynchus nerka TaxID=8023 RepID=UPI0031B8880B